MLKYQVTGKTTTDSVGKVMEEIPVKYTWYRFIDLQDQKWVEPELGKMPSRDPILETFSSKFQNQAPWREDELKYMSEEGKMRKATREAFDRWEFDGTKFYLQLEDK